MSSSNYRYDVVIIGAGPAGLAAAVGAVRSGLRTAVVEQLAAPGRKLLASGGGRCNVSNKLAPREMASSFGNAGRFVRHALYSYPNSELCRFFEQNGVDLELTDEFHWFPRSGRAQDILDLLLDASHTAVFTSHPAEKLLFDSGRVSGVQAGNKTFYAPKVIIACGGRSYPVLGGTGSGYALAEQAGHRIVPPVPAMVGLQCRENWVRECAGISLPDAESRIALPGEKMSCRGELLFTHTGVSAFAVLDISGRVSELLAQRPSIPLEINLFAGRNAEMWQDIFERWQREAGNRSVTKLLAQEMPKKLAAFLVGDDELKSSGFSKAARHRLAGKLTGLKLEIFSTDGWNKAMVTRGGIALDEVDPKTMESRLMPGLFFAGEVLDVDGPCGGYNISWALASGFLTGNMVI